MTAERTSFTKKFFAVLLAAVMVFGLMPTTAFAVTLDTTRSFVCDQGPSVISNPAPVTVLAPKASDGYTYKWNHDYGGDMFAKLSKQATYVEGTLNEFEIQFTIEGNKITPPPMNTVSTLVLDYSRSMVTNNASQGVTRLAALKAAAEAFINTLTEYDFLSVVLYAGTAKTVQNFTQMTAANKTALINLIKGSDITGSRNNDAKVEWNGEDTGISPYTNIQSGIVAAYQMMNNVKGYNNAGASLVAAVDSREDTKYNVILMTDGEANRVYYNLRTTADNVGSNYIKSGYHFGSVTDQAGYGNTISNITKTAANNLGNLKIGRYESKADVYTIGLNTGTSNIITEMAQNNGAYYSGINADDLTAIFRSVASDMLSSVNRGILTDILPDDFTLMNADGNFFTAKKVVKSTKQGVPDTEIDFTANITAEHEDGIIRFSNLNGIDDSVKLVITFKVEAPTTCKGTSGTHTHTADDYRNTNSSAALLFTNDAIVNGPSGYVFLTAMVGSPVVHVPAYAPLDLPEMEITKKIDIDDDVNPTGWIFDFDFYIDGEASSFIKVGQVSYTGADFTNGVVAVKKTVRLIDSYTMEDLAGRTVYVKETITQPTGGTDGEFTSNLLPSIANGYTRFARISEISNSTLTIDYNTAYVSGGNFTVTNTFTPDLPETITFKLQKFFDIGPDGLDYENTGTLRCRTEHEHDAECYFYTFIFKDIDKIGFFGDRHSSSHGFSTLTDDTLFLELSAAEILELAESKTCVTITSPVNFRGAISGGIIRESGSGNGFNGGQTLDSLTVSIDRLGNINYGTYSDLDGNNISDAVVFTNEYEVPDYPELLIEKFVTVYDADGNADNESYNGTFSFNVDGSVITIDVTDGYGSTTVRFPQYYGLDEAVTVHISEVAPTDPADGEWYWDGTQHSFRVSSEIRDGDMNIAESVEFNNSLWLYGEDGVEIVKEVTSETGEDTFTFIYDIYERYELLEGEPLNDYPFFDSYEEVVLEAELTLAAAAGADELASTLIANTTLGTGFSGIVVVTEQNDGKEGWTYDDTCYVFVFDFGILRGGLSYASYLDFTDVLYGEDGAWVFVEYCDPEITVAHFENSYEEPITTEPTVSISKSGSETLIIGPSFVNYRLTITNTGDEALGNIVVTDDKLAGYTINGSAPTVNVRAGDEAISNEFASARGTITLTPNFVLEPGASFTITYNMFLFGAQTNTATVTAIGVQSEGEATDSDSYAVEYQPSSSETSSQTSSQASSQTSSYTPVTSSTPLISIPSSSTPLNELPDGGASGEVATYLLTGGAIICGAIPFLSGKSKKEEDDGE